MVNRGLKPKIATDDHRGQQCSTLQSRRNTTSVLSQQIANPPSINRKLKPHPHESLSQTLPRNFNNSNIYNNSNVYHNNNHPQAISASSHHPKQPVLDYLELDTSNAPPICQNSTAASNVAASTATLSGNKTTNAFGSMQRVAVPSSSAAAEESSIVYKSVDFIKTEAIKRTRQDRAQNISHID